MMPLTELKRTFLDFVLLFFHNSEAEHLNYYIVLLSRVLSLGTRTSSIHSFVEYRTELSVISLEVFLLSSMHVVSPHGTNTRANIHHGWDLNHGAMKLRD